MIVAHPHPDQPVQPVQPGMGTRKMHRQRNEPQEIRPHKREKAPHRPGTFWPIMAVIVLAVNVSGLGMERLDNGWSFVFWGVVVGGSSAILVRWARDLADWARGGR